jgi:hypothetical protein
MPLPELFEHIDYDNDPLQIVKKALNEFNNSHFPRFVESLVIYKEGGGGEHGGCRFAKALDESELYADYNGVPFEGVECWSYDDQEIIVSEHEFYKCLKLACDKYIELHPETRDELEQIMSQSTLIQLL